MGSWKSNGKICVCSGNYSAQLYGGARVLKWARVFLSVSQISTVEALIGRKSAILRRWLVRALYSDHVLLRVRSFQLKFNGEGRNYGFDLPGQSIPPHVDSDKLRNELHS